MNKEYFIARRLIKREAGTRQLSKPIVVISTWGIAIGMIVMILAVAIVTGFQSEIRNKVIGFGSHIQINSRSEHTSYESTPILIDQPFYHSIDTVQGVRNIQIYATKPGIIQTKEDIQGIIAKGVGPDCDWSFFDDKMRQGKVFGFPADDANDSIMISEYQRSKLKLDLHDTLVTIFIPESGSPKRREFIIGGVYETGLEDFDHQVMMVDLRHIQALNNWGMKVVLKLDPDCDQGRLAISARGVGKHKNFQYRWENPRWQGEGPHFLCPKGDTTIRVIGYDVPPRGEEASLPDTAWMHIKFNRPADSPTDCRCDEDAYETELVTTGGSGKYYTGGFEVLLDDYDQLPIMDDLIRYHIGYELETATITEQFPEIFAWLEMIDVNVYVLVVLMILVSVINMVSALLILILENTRLIGVLKAMGATNWSIRKIFIYNASYLILKGMFWGNVIGLALCAIQHYFKVVKLAQENYYISEVPINFDIVHLIILNIGTLTICFLMMLFPSFLITKITPVRAIRFN